MAKSMMPFLWVLVFAFTPSIQAEESEVAPAPILVAMTSGDPGEAVLAWLPAGPADYYRVYAIQDGTPTLIATSSDPVETVPAGYPAYAVSAVWNGAESGLTMALNAHCVVIGTHTVPPDVNIMWDCESTKHLKKLPAIRSLDPPAPVG